MNEDAPVSGIPHSGDLLSPSNGGVVSDLNLGVIGNCSFSALIDERARIVWSCLPRFDGDPVFCSLMNNGAGEEQGGFFDVTIDGQVKSRQYYLDNTAVLVTELEDAGGSVLRITDFAPRFTNMWRVFRPLMIIRHLDPIVGKPRVRIRLRPLFDHGASTPAITRGSNHVRYIGPDETLRLNTNVPIAYILGEQPFLLDRPMDMMLGPDEPLASPLVETCRDFQKNTIQYWRDWVRHLAIPLEWQDAVIRAAITLHLCLYEETGAIVAAMTTSIPEAEGTERNWDYRYCWLRDAYFVVMALNRLGAVDIMENYLRYVNNLVTEVDGGHLQPVYGIALERELTERIVDSLAGYRGHAPVRIGNQAYEHLQHDVYGNVVLAATQAFFDRRLFRPSDAGDFQTLESVGQRAFALHDQPDAGMWELRTKAEVHTSSSIMCWAACDRLAKIAAHLGFTDRARDWRAKADKVHGTILRRAWSEERGVFVESFEGTELDASLLLMAEIGFIDPKDPRFAATVDAIAGELLRGTNMFRYVAPDDFGEPHNAFNICTFWYIETLAHMGRDDEARDLFQAMLAQRNHLGLLSEDLHPATSELWGNYPQTYSLVGIINSAMRLSKAWEEVL